MRTLISDSMQSFPSASLASKVCYRRGEAFYTWGLTWGWVEPICFSMAARLSSRRSSWFLLHSITAVSFCVACLVCACGRHVQG